MPKLRIELGPTGKSSKGVFLGDALLPASRVTVTSAVDELTWALIEIRPVDVTVVECDKYELTIEIEGRQYKFLNPEHYDFVRR